MFNKTVSATVILTVLLPQQLVQAAINRDNLRGGALGIIQCQHLKGSKTKVIWQVIVSKLEKPINGTKFHLQANGETQDIFEVVIPPKTNYQTTEIFDGLKTNVTISGEAYNISFSGVYRYYLRKPLIVQCD